MFVHRNLNYFGTVCNVGDFDGLFTVEIHHKGFFCGAGSNRTYMDYQVDWFDSCDSDTWSILWIEDFLKQLGYDRDSG